MLGFHVGSVPQTLNEDAVFLNPFYAGTRYPADIPIESFTWERSEAAFVASQRIKAFVLSKIYGESTTRRGFSIPTISIIIFLILSIGLGGGLYWKELRKENSVTEEGIKAREKAEELRKNNQEQFKEYSSGEVEKTQSEDIDTSGWKTYRNEKYGFELKYPQTVGFDDNVISYAHTFDGVGDWALSSNVADRIRKDFTCQALADANLSIDFEKKNICKVSIINGKSIIYSIGLDIPFESTHVLAAVIVILREKDFILFTFEKGVVSELPPATEVFVDEFTKKNPDIEFPSYLFKQLYDLIVKSLQEEVSLPAPEITEGMKLLKDIVNSIKFIN